MWNMVPFGILMPSLRPAKYIPEGDNRILQVRVRRAKELDILRDQYMGDELGPTVHLPGTDYEYRAYCTPEAYARAMTKMIMDIDYVKFKPTTDRYNDHQLHSTYNRIWSVVFNEHSTPKHKADYLGTATKAVGGSRYYPSLPTSTFYGSSSGGKGSDYRWTAGTEYDDPDFKGYAAPTVAGKNWWDDAGGFEEFILDDMETADPDPVIEDDPAVAVTESIEVEATKDPEGVSVADPNDTVMLNTDQLAACLNVNVVKVREFLGSPMSDWQKQTNGKYEVPFKEFRAMARRFYEWQDAKAKQQ